jgi:hypothetical protein
MNKLLHARSLPAFSGNKNKKYKEFTLWQKERERLI